MAIRILVDSASDININEANELGISLIPIIVSFEDEQYYDGVNLLPHEFYDKLEASAVKQLALKYNLNIPQTYY